MSISTLERPDVLPVTIEDEVGEAAEKLISSILTEAREIPSVWVGPIDSMEWVKALQRAPLSELPQPALHPAKLAQFARDVAGYLQRHGWSKGNWRNTENDSVCVMGAAIGVAHHVKPEAVSQFTPNGLSTVWSLPLITAFERRFAQWLNVSHVTSWNDAAPSGVTSGCPCSSCKLPPPTVEYPTAQHQVIAAVLAFAEHLELQPA